MCFHILIYTGRVRRKEKFENSVNKQVLGAALVSSYTTASLQVLGKNGISILRKQAASFQRYLPDHSGSCHMNVFELLFSCKTRRIQLKKIQK